MHAAPSRRSDRVAIVGLVLVAAGIAAYVLREIGLDPIRVISHLAWPVFVVAPGLILVLAAVIVPRPNGVALAIPGAIVTSIGLLLWYQTLTGHWESWAYAWALVGPGAAGLALFLYGTGSRDATQVGVGLRLMGIAAIVFVVGLLFFETIFESGRLPVDLGATWPFLVIAIGAVLVGGSVLGGGSRPTGDSGDHASASRG